ncbi:MAG: sugar phosphate isomerase/epimerase [Actinobacteria bacterium]|nr:sugar phosphate isomerase/epimerase [Actinomycetota bacterium]
MIVRNGKKIRFSTILSTFGNRYDRYCVSGYKKNKSIEEMFVAASKVQGLEGIELVGGRQVNEENLSHINQLKSNFGFEISSIIVDLFSEAVWKKGSFTSVDETIRKEAINKVKRYMDIAPELGCDLVCLWFAQDGFDYVFQSDYIKSWNFLVNSLKQCATYRHDVKIGVEYKIKEPRTYNFIANIGKTLSLLSKVGEDNIGIILDVGHALCAYENMAESVALCKFFGDKLFHIHFNDNYRHWDDDMIIGSVHVPEYLELIYWLKKVNYNGWYSIDIYPYREEGTDAVNECIRWLRKLIELVDNFDQSEIERVINSGEGIKSIMLVREMLFGK